MRYSRHTTAFGSVVLALVLACSACSSSPDVKALGQKFEAIVKSTDKALTRDRSVKHQATSFAKYSVDFHNAAVQLRALTFPPSMQHDARALVTALDLLSTDAAKVAKAAAKPQSVLKNVQAFAKLNLTLMEDEKSEQTISKKLRSDLGLPQETTTTTTAPSTLTPTPPTPLTTVPTTTATSTTAAG
ncbi:MAG TPA: hypothetical protein VNC61_02160 [Acidimicrobiales bacterium]|nr:hypothetical protein [Acidimicrobiales bacterium]